MIECGCAEEDKWDGMWSPYYGNNSQSGEYRSLSMDGTINNSQDFSKFSDFPTILKNSQDFSRILRTSRGGLSFTAKPELRTRGDLSPKQAC